MTYKYTKFIIKNQKQQFLIFNYKLLIKIKVLLPYSKSVE